MHRSTVTIKTPLFLPLSRSNGKRSQTAGKKQDGNRAVSRGIPATTEKKQEPTQPVILLPAPEKVLEDSDFKKTGRTIIKQMAGFQVYLNVREYHADVYYNTKTGKRVHAAFPAGVVDEVNYDGSIRAFLFLLNNDCCVSIDKSRRFLSDLTGGKLNISKGMVSKPSREFALKTVPERRTAYADMLLSPVMPLNSNRQLASSIYFLFQFAKISEDSFRNS